jgi:hypothetical protein
VSFEALLLKCESGLFSAGKLKRSLKEFSAPAVAALRKKRFGRRCENAVLAFEYYCHKHAEFVERRLEALWQAKP